MKVYVRIINKKKGIRDFASCDGISYIRWRVGKVVSKLGKMLSSSLFSVMFKSSNSSKVEVAFQPF